MSALLERRSACGCGGACVAEWIGEAVDRLGLCRVLPDGRGFVARLYTAVCTCSACDDWDVCVESFLEFRGGGDASGPRIARRLGSAEVDCEEMACRDDANRTEHGRREERGISALGALPDPGGEFLDVIEHLTAIGHLVEDLFLRVHHRGVIAPEGLADLGQ